MKLFKREEKMNRLPHVVIIGAGFGGLEAAKRLAKAPVQITLIDKRNYHLFQPLLYQVAIAGLSPVQIAHPVRAILRRQRNLSFLMAEVSDIDFKARKVLTEHTSLDYDYLIVAAGSRTNFFGMGSIEKNSHDMKDISSAVATRNHLLKMFEKASRETNEAARRSILTFVVVGGGPTGVESAGALSELIHLVLTKDYPQMDLREARVILVEASNHLMPNVYPRNLQAATLKILRRKQVSVRLRVGVTGFDGECVTLSNGETIPAQTLIWTAGVRVAFLVEKLDLEKGPGGRMIVKPTLQLPGYPEVYVIGDAAYLEDEKGQPLAMLATVAQQQARHVARNIHGELRERPPNPFRYKDPGLLATIGRNAAVARLAGISFSGLLAWLIWVGLHIYRLIGFRNRLVVMLNWAWDYFFYDSQVRLITTE
jgi:NADH:ubiquinone reductase (H+-translocating)